MSDRVVVLEVTRNVLPQMARAVAPAVAEAVNAGVRDFLSVADATVPVDTGALRANKDIQSASAGNPNASVTYRQGYAGFVHDGTVRMAPRPWAADAVRSIAGSYEARLAQAFGSAIEGAG